MACYDHPCHVHESNDKAVDGEDTLFDSSESKDEMSIKHIAAGMDNRNHTSLISFYLDTNGFLPESGWGASNFECRNGPGRSDERSREGKVTTSLIRWYCWYSSLPYFLDTSTHHPWRAACVHLLRLMDFTIGSGRQKWCKTVYIHIKIMHHL